MSSIEITTQSDDGTHLKARIFYENGKIIREATRKFGEVHVYFTNMVREDDTGWIGGFS